MRGYCDVIQCILLYITAQIGHNTTYFIHYNLEIKRRGGGTCSIHSGLQQKDNPETDGEIRDPIMNGGGALIVKIGQLLATENPHSSRTFSSIAYFPSST